MKKISLLALLMTFVSFTSRAVSFWATTTEGTTVQLWCIQNSSTNTVKINMLHNPLEGSNIDLVIPAQVTYNGETYTVTEIANNCFLYCNGAANIESVTIPSTVTTVEINAFKGCTNLKTVTIQGSTTVKSYAFKNCSSLSTVNVSNSATIQPRAFEGCSYLDPSSWRPEGTNAMYLYTGRWNLVAGTGQTFDILNSNQPDLRPNVTATDKHCDIAAISFDYSNNNWYSDNDHYLLANDTMTAGESYFVYVWDTNYVGTVLTDDNALTTVDMTGKYLTNNVTLQSHTNSGTASASGTTNTVSAKWFAYGNPFDKKLAVTNVLQGLNSVRANTLYVYDAQNQKWLSDKDSVNRGEGFMVAAANGQNTVSGTLTYPTNSKATTEINYGIKFTVNANDISSRIYAKQVANGSDGFDNNDAYALFGTGEDLVEPYFVVDGVELFHNRYASNNYTCDINFHAQKDGVATLSVSDVPEGTTVSIINVATGEETVLDENTNFEINVEQGENAGKYKVKITKGALSIADVENMSDVNVWNNKGNIYVSGKDLKTVEVLNTLGQSIYMQQVGGNEYNFNLDIEGSFIVRVKSQLGVKSQKIIVTK